MLIPFSLSTPFVYRPRTRPSNAPPVVDGSVLGALKLSPELWAAHPRALGPSSSPSTSALARSEVRTSTAFLRTYPDIMQLLLPKSGVFCLSSKVPVHVQLVDPAHAWARQPPEEPSVHIPSSPSSPPQPQALPRAMNSELNLVSHPAHKRSSSGSSRWWRTLVTPSPPLPTPPARRSRRPATAPSAPQQPPRPALARRASLSVPRELDVVESAASMPSASALAGPRVFLVRRVSLSLGSVRACGAYACGEATLRRLSGVGIAGAWEGAIELDAARLHRVPGFRAAGLSVEVRSVSLLLRASSSCGISGLCGCRVGRRHRRARGARSPRHGSVPRAVAVISPLRRGREGAAVPCWMCRLPRDDHNRVYSSTVAKYE